MIPGDIAGKVGRGWTEAGRDTLGELILRIWLTENGVAAEGARRATEGWGGDRLVLLRAPDGSLAVAMKTTWDTPDDALEFATSLLVATKTGGLDGRVLPPGRHPRRAGRDRRRRRRGPGGAAGLAAGYIASGAEIPSRASAFASEIRVASTRARRFAERSGSSGSTTRASR